MILDEATSALDRATQDRICENLVQLDNTRVVVAHRLSTVRHCDRIIVMAAGEIVQQGTWESLSAEPGRFAELLAHEMR